MTTMREVHDNHSGMQRRHPGRGVARWVVAILAMAGLLGGSGCILGVSSSKTDAPDTSEASDAGTSPADGDRRLSSEQVLESVTAKTWFTVLDGRAIDGSVAEHEAGVLASVNIRSSDDRFAGGAVLQFGPLPVTFDWEAKQGLGDAGGLEIVLDGAEYGKCDDSNHGLMCGLWRTYASLADPVDKIVLRPRPVDGEPTSLVGEIHPGGDGSTTPVVLGLEQMGGLEPASLEGKWEAVESGPVTRTLEVTLSVDQWRAEVTSPDSFNYEGRLLTLDVAERTYWGVIDRGEPLNGGLVRDAGSDGRQLLHPESKEGKLVSPSELHRTMD